MADEFDADEAARRLRRLGERIGQALVEPRASERALSIVEEISDEITELLNLNQARLKMHGDTGLSAENTDLVAIFEQIARTLSFARQNGLGVPTLVDADAHGDLDPAHITIIDIFDSVAIGRVARASPGLQRSLQAFGSSRLADFLRIALFAHPWARWVEEKKVVRTLGLEFGVLAARSKHSAMIGTAHINFTVNTQIGNLVLDAFPEMTYAPRRFGSCPSTPVSGSLNCGWWKFETIDGGKLKRDRGRHLVSSASTSTVTRDF